MIRKEKNKSRFTIIGSFLILVSITIYSSYKVYNYVLNNKEEKAINDFFRVKNINISEEETDNNSTTENETSKEEYNYIGVLEIPKLNLQKGFLNINDKNNNVNKNIQVLKGSKFPDIENSTLAIAGHSGTGRIAFFKDLYKMTINDLAYIYYKNLKYTYKVISIQNEEKDGTIEVGKYKNTTLVLTTCSQSNKRKQIVITLKLINKENF